MRELAIVLPEVSKLRAISEMFFPLIRNFPPAPLFLLHRTLLYNPWFLTLGGRRHVRDAGFVVAAARLAGCKDRRMKQLHSFIGVPTYVLETAESSVHVSHSGHFRATIRQTIKKTLGASQNVTRRI
jgi:hypothetical protein